MGKGSLRYVRLIYMIKEDLNDDGQPWIHDSLVTAKSLIQ